MKNLSQFLKKIKDYNLIFFAETHGLIDETPIQKSIIKVLRPKLFLYELLEESEVVDYDLFLSKPDKELFSMISTYGDLKGTIRLAKEFNLNIKGCDIKNMLRENRDFLKKAEFDDEEKIIMKKREEHQNLVIKQALKESQGPVFASLGYYHLRKKSPTLKDLKDFVVVYPINPNKNSGYRIKIGGGY